MTKINHDPAEAERISSRTASSINCKPKTCAVRPEKPGLIIRKDKFVFAANRNVFTDAYLIPGDEIGYKAKS